MMNLYQLLGKVDDISEFHELEDFIVFARQYTEFIYNNGMQAEIVSKNENNYHFYQYKDDGHYCITRPVNMDLFIKHEDFDDAETRFINALKDIKSIENDRAMRENINRFIYTCQQCIGCSLDALNNPNKARKRNGLYFEMLIRSVISKTGINIDCGDEIISVDDMDVSMKFQHDIILKNAADEIKAIGQMKTSSKDRLDKIFLDKFMYLKLKETDIPYFAIFLNDVQRKEIKKQGFATQYGINSTFLPGHFNAYRIALNPLDGVYYFDLRPSMKNDEMLSPYIKSFDTFLVEDMWSFL